MTISRFMRGAAALLALVGMPAIAAAQGTTTGAIGGTVTGDQNQPVEGAQVQITSRATGFTAGALTRSNGTYLVQGLEVGGGYSVNVRRIGYGPQVLNDVRVTLSQVTRVDFTLEQQAAQVDAVVVTAQSTGAIISPTRVGAATSVSDTMISRLPSLNRDFSDFATLAPQVSAVPGSGISAGGISNRFNSIQIDGASASDLFGLGSTGQPGGSVGAKSISVESVKEYQVLLSPFDVRQGNFVGMLVNAVTKSGTNEFHGSAYGFARDQQITRQQDYLDDFEQQQYGFSLGGPIVRDKAFFFINPEWQRQVQPTSGPFIGSADAPVNQATVDQVNAALLPYGINGGSGAYIASENPLTDVFARLDVNLPWSSRLALRHKYGTGTRTNFSRSDNGSEFRLTSNAYEFSNETNSTVAQLFTTLPNGFSNEFQLGYTIIDDSRAFDAATPQVSVRVPRTSGTGSTNITSGTERSSQGNELYQTILEVADNVSFPIGSHNLTVGTKNFFYYSDNLFAQDRFGTWQFNSLDSLNRGEAASYSVRTPIGDQARAKFHAATYGVYAQDRWQIRPTMNLTLGLRADIPTFDEKPPFNQSVLDEYGRRTDEVPSGRIQWQPRVGFNWDVTGDERNQFRAGIGMFSGPPAYVWLSNAFGNTGVSGFPSLSCNSTTNTRFLVPTFTPETAANPPQACAGPLGATAAVSGAVNLLNPDFNFPRTMKTTVGFDHRFGEETMGGLLRDIVGTVEMLYTKGVDVPFYVNLALDEAATTVGAHGRVMYGTISGTSSSPRTIGSRREVYDVINSDKDYSYNLTTGLTKRYSTNWEGSLFYTYTQAFDLQSTSNSTAGSNFGIGRVHAGSQYSQELAPSRWATPHRFVANGTYTFPTRTAVTMVYSGSSGPAYSYYYATDENGDGYGGNDILYVPADVFDPSEVRFRASSNATIEEQQAALDEFITNVSCLDDQRGQILERNSCQSNWINMLDLSVRQSLPTFRGQNVSLQWDVFNFGNLLNRNWGIIRNRGDVGFAGVRLLRRTGTVTEGTTVVPQYEFNTDTEYYTFRSAASNYRMQLSVRYSF